MVHAGIGAWAPRCRIIVKAMDGQMNKVSTANLEATLKSTVVSMATRDDVDMTDVAAKSQEAHDAADLLQTTYSDAFAFSDGERLALQLYDQLQELELQQSLLEAQQSGMF